MAGVDEVDPELEPESPDLVSEVFDEEEDAEDEDDEERLSVL
ncbi:hypothetical protein ABGB18_41515 [Nonomuraea sp. B12E4]